MLLGVIGHTIRVPVAVCVAVLALAALFPAAAGAWRRPTPAEKRVLTHLAKRTPHAGSPKKKLHVSDIKVSTVGPWAIATISIYFNHRPLPAYAFFHKYGHRWHLSRGSGAGVSCGTKMPDRVKADLGVPC